MEARLAVAVEGERVTRLAVDPPLTAKVADDRTRDVLCRSYCLSHAMLRGRRVEATGAIRHRGTITYCPQPRNSRDSEAFVDQKTAT